MLPRKSFPLALPLDILAQFLSQGEKRGWWSSEASGSTGQAGQPGQNEWQGVLCDIQAHPHVEKPRLRKGGRGKVCGTVPQ